MPNPVAHLVIAEKVHAILGDRVITNLPLFYSGNLVPDAIHAKENFQREDKKRCHLSDGIRAYGHVDPVSTLLFNSRLEQFIEKYYYTAGQQQDLYLGYVIHLLADQYNLTKVYEHLEERLIKNGFDIEQPGFRKSMIGNAEYKHIFDEIEKRFAIHFHEYKFERDIVSILESVWDYEVRDHITANWANISKRWVINTFLKDSLSAVSVTPCYEKIAFIDDVVKRIIARVDKLKIFDAQ